MTELLENKKQVWELNWNTDWEQTTINIKNALKELQEILWAWYFELDLDQEIVLATEWVYKMYGIKNADNTPIKQEKLWMHIDKNDKIKYLWNLRRAIEKNTSYSVEYSITDTNNNKHILLEKWKLVMDWWKKKIEGVVEDITEDKKKENELRITKEKIDDMNSKQLRFNASLSHEIRTPLNWISWISQILMRSNLDQKQEYLVNDLKMLSNDLLLLINDILDIRKIESWNMILETIKLDMVEIIFDIKTAQSYLLKDEVKIDFQIWNNMPKIMWDPQRIKQIISVLISNAVQFTENWTITIKCDFDHTNSTITIQVVDTWIWMTEEGKNMIFQKYIILWDKSTNKITWKWLWISLASDIIKIMWWELKVDSVKWQWSNFYFTIPATKAPEEKRKKYDISNIDPDIIKTYWKDKKVLIVDDNIINQEIASIIFTEYNVDKWNISIASNWKEAIELIKKKKLDFVFMDIVMPIMNWDIALNTIRKMPGWENLVVVASTADAGIWKKHEYITKWFDGYVSKPYDFIETMQQLRLIMKEKNSIFTNDNSNEDKSKLDKFDFSLWLVFWKKILITEKDKISAELLNIELSDKDIEYTIVKNWKEAIDAVEKNWNYDFILMDNNISEQYWWATTKILRQMTKIPILVYTASHENDIEEIEAYDWCIRKIDKIWDPSMWDKLIINLAEKIIYFQILAIICKYINSKNAEEIDYDSLISFIQTNLDYREKDKNNIERNQFLLNYLLEVKNTLKNLTTNEDTFYEEMKKIRRFKEYQLRRDQTTDILTSLKILNIHLYNKIDILYKKL